jgi:AcrR family transcriptional regulator
VTRRPGRPALTDRRRAETRAAASREAARLFAEQGYAATTVEQIAHACGMAPRTFYTYFRGKEETVAPLLAEGFQDWTRRLDACPPGSDLVEALTRTYAEAVRAASAGPGGAGLPVRAVLRTVRAEPALRAVWLGVHRDCEEALRPVLARLTGRDPDDLDVHLTAGLVNTAVRVAMERWAAGPDDGPAPEDAVADALARVAGAGLLRPAARA